MRLPGFQKNVDAVDIVDNNKVFSIKYLESAIVYDKLRQKNIHNKVKIIHRRGAKECNLLLWIMWITKFPEDFRLFSVHLLPP